jgi:hypothetical protein
MTRTLAWMVRVAPVIVSALLVSTAQAQGYAPAPAAPGTAPQGYPPGYPGAPGQPAQPTPGQPGLVDTPPDDESKDSGLGLEWVWLDADAGYAYTDLASFNQSSLGLQKTASSGPVFGAGVGARLLFFTFGVRARDLILDNIGNLWEIGAEAAFHLRVWRIDPYFGVRGGYNFVGSLDQANVGSVTGSPSPSVSVHGFNVGPMIGIDYYFAHWISIGADVDAQFLFLQRPAIAVPAGLNVSSLPPSARAQANLLYNESGSSAGIQVSPTAHLGIHF